MNYAQAFTRDIVGYTYSSGTSYSARTPDKTDEVQELDGTAGAIYYCRAKSAADDQFIGGHGYVEVLSQDDGDSPLQVVHLQPDNTEVVYSEHVIRICACLPGTVTRPLLTIKVIVQCVYKQAYLYR